MATWDDVRRLALALPQTTERIARDGQLAWDVRDKTFAWERPLRRGDLQALGDTYFTTPHFNGFPAILVQLDHIGPADLEELLVEAWLARAPRRLAQEYLDG
jgi:hypothetical protein